jgi:hypothetical protein
VGTGSGKVKQVLLIHSLLFSFRAYPDTVQQFKDAEAAEKLLKKKAARSRKGAKPQTSSNPRSGRDGSAEVLNPLPENLHSAALRTDGPDRLFVCGPAAEQTVCLVGSSLAAERENGGCCTGLR